MTIKDTYLGDGVYASFDGYQIWLRAERDGQEHSIAIEPPVMTALVAYADEIWMPGSVIRTALDERYHSEGEIGIRFRWQQLGGHVHVRVFVGKVGCTHAKAGDLCFDPAEWAVFREHMERRFEVVPEDDA